MAASAKKNNAVVVAGEKPGSKLDKAKELGFAVLTEDEFLARINYQAD